MKSLVGKQQDVGKNIPILRRKFKAAGLWLCHNIFLKNLGSM
jgi:hypothetical protein